MTVTTPVPSWCDPEEKWAEKSIEWGNEPDLVDTETNRTQCRTFKWRSVRCRFAFLKLDLKLKYNVVFIPYLHYVNSEIHIYIYINKQTKFDT